MIPLHLPEVRRVLEQVGLRNKARAESYLKKELLKLGIHEPDDIEPLADIIAGQVRQALRRRQQDKSIYTKRDLGLKVRKVIDEYYDKAPMDAEINKAIEKVGSRVKRSYTKKERKASEVLSTFCSAGYYGYLKLRQLLGIPLEHPMLRSWYAKFLPSIPNLLNPGGEVKLLEGTYNISTPIDVMKSDVALSGVGTATKLFLIDGANCHVIQIGDGATALEDVVIRDLQIDGNKANQGAGHGIYIYGGAANPLEKICIDSLYLLNVYATGIYSYYCYKTNILNSTFEGAGGNGIFADYAYEWCISFNKLLSNTMNGITLDSPSDNSTVIGNILYLQNQDVELKSDYVVALGNAFRNTGGIYASGGRCAIVGNRIHNPVCYCIYSKGIGNTIVGNNAYGGNGYPIRCDEDYNTISANNVWYSLEPYDGIYLAVASYVTISSNVVRLTGGSGIRLYSSDYNTIIGNICTANTGYGINISDAGSNVNFIGKNYLTGNTLGAINDAGTGTILGVVDTVNNIDNVT